MAVPYATPFQLGKLALELLPSGTGWGSSMLRFRRGDTTVLVAPSARLDALPGTPSLSWREADVLLLHAPDHEERANVEALTAFVGDAVAVVLAGHPVTLVCEALPVALAVWRLAGAVVPVQPAVQLARWASRHRAAGLDLAAEPAPHRARRARLRIALAGRSGPQHLATAASAVSSRGAVRGGVLRTIGAASSHGLAFAVSASGAALVALAAASGARQVRVWGAGAVSAVEAMRRVGLAAAVLSTERQLPLV
jgi:hypothetical protein